MGTRGRVLSKVSVRDTHTDNALEAHEVFVLRCGSRRASAAAATACAASASMRAVAPSRDAIAASSPGTNAAWAEAEGSEKPRNVT